MPTAEKQPLSISVDQYLGVKPQTIAQKLAMKAHEARHRSKSTSSFGSSPGTSPCPSPYLCKKDSNDLEVITSAYVTFQGFIHAI